MIIYFFSNRFWAEWVYTPFATDWLVWNK